MGTRQSSAAYRELGQMLRQVREGAGLTVEGLTQQLGLSPTTISRMENGLRTSTTTDVIQYVVMCGLRERELRPIVEFTRMAERKQGYYLSDERIGGSLQSLIFHESSADSSTIYEPQVIHGLLQTPDYARALVTAVHSDLDEEWVAGVVRTRMDRQRILSLPAGFTFYLHENALRLRVGSYEVMLEQLLHIVLMAALENVAVRIVPSAAGERSALGGAFRLMEFDRHRPIVYLDNLGGGGLILEDPEYVGNYRKLVGRLADVALGEGQSREFAAELADAYDRGGQRGATDVLAQEQLQRRVGIRLRGSGMAEEQSQRRVGNQLRGGGVAESSTAIYE